MIVHCDVYSGCIQVSPPLPHISHLGVVDVSVQKSGIRDAIKGHLLFVDSTWNARP